MVRNYSWWVKHLKRLEQSINHSPTMFNLSPSDLKVFVRKESNLSPASDRLFLWSLGDWNFLRQPYKDTTAENMTNSRTDLSEHPCAITPCIRAQFDYHYHERHYQPIIYMSGFVRRRVVQRETKMTESLLVQDKNETKLKENGQRELLNTPSKQD